jgi:hypothetical protein
VEFSIEGAAPCGDQLTKHRASASLPAMKRQRIMSCPGSSANNDLTVRTEGSGVRLPSASQNWRPTHRRPDSEPGKPIRLPFVSAVYIGRSDPFGSFRMSFFEASKSQRVKWPGFDSYGNQQATRQHSLALLELHMFCLGLSQDRDIRVGVFPRLLLYDQSKGHGVFQDGRP